MLISERIRFIYFHFKCQVPVDILIYVLGKLLTTLLWLVLPNSSYHVFNSYWSYTKEKSSDWIICLADYLKFKVLVKQNVC